MLVTGMSGLIGAALRGHLAGIHELHALNRRPVPGLPGRQADITDLAAILPAFAGMEVVVNLAAVVGGDAPLEAVLQTNMIGTDNVLEAARRAGVRRVVFASSGATVSGWEREMPYQALVAGRYGDVGSWTRITHETPVRPAGLYGGEQGVG